MKKTKKMIAVLLATLAVIPFSGCNFADESEQIANVVTDAYHDVQNFFIGAYGKMEDQFIAWFFAKDGETVEEAKDRLNKNK